MKRIPLILALILLPAFAIAQASGVPAPTTTNHVVIGWGDWVSAILTYLEPVLAIVAMSAVTWLAGMVGGPLAALAQSMLTESVLQKAIDYGFGAVNGAIKGKTLDINTNNAILNTAVQYVVANAPAMAEKYASTLRAKLLSRLSATGSIPASATALDHGVTLPVAASK